MGCLKHQMGLKDPEASEHKGVCKPGNDDIARSWGKVPINKEKIAVKNTGSLHGGASNLQEISGSMGPQERRDVKPLLSKQFAGRGKASRNTGQSG
jgi:hypothetical protein